MAFYASLAAVRVFPEAVDMQRAFGAWAQPNFKRGVAAAVQTFHADAF